MAAEYEKLSQLAEEKAKTIRQGVFGSLYNDVASQMAKKALIVRSMGVPENITQKFSTRREFPGVAAEILLWKRRLNGTIPLFSVPLQTGSQIAIAPRKSAEVFAVTIIRTKRHSSDSINAIADNGEKLSFGCGTKAVLLNE